MQSRRSDAAGTRAVVLLACVVASFLGGAGEARAQDAGGQAYDCVVKPSLIVKLVHRFIRMVLAYPVNAHDRYM